MLLEIISGKRTAGFYQYGKFFNLTGYVSTHDINWSSKSAYLQTAKPHFSFADNLKEAVAHCKPCLILQAYQLWQEAKWHEMVDQVLGVDYPVTEVMKCFQVALLCVQDSADDRPSMSDVVAMLSGEGLTLPEPRLPAYFNVRLSSLPESNSSFGESSYISNVALTDEDGR